MMRTHVVLPEDLVKEIDRVAGRRKRSQFIEEAVSEKLQRESLWQAMQDFKGSLIEDGPPWWSTQEKRDAWFEATRTNDAKTLRELGYLK